MAELASTDRQVDPLGSVLILQSLLILVGLRAGAIVSVQKQLHFTL